MTVVAELLLLLVLRFTTHIAIVTRKIKDIVGLFTVVLDILEGLVIGVIVAVLP